jgi:hypothetical protein
MWLSVLWLIWIGSMLPAKEPLVASSKKSVEHQTRLPSVSIFGPLR